MTDEWVRPAHQCVMCDARAVDPDATTPLCETHQPEQQTGDDTPDTPPTPPGRTPPDMRDVYLTAHDRAGADRAFVPESVVADVLADHGRRDLLGNLDGHRDWLVWTPDQADEPLYAYTPDLAGDTSRPRNRLADRLREARVGTQRFIKVHDGQKGRFDSTPKHPGHDALAGNYGVVGGRGGRDAGPWLVDVDVDDYDDAKESNPRVEELRGDTLAVASAHTTKDRPGHLYVAVDGDPRDVTRELSGSGTNLTASFGEIRVENQYVVGPGSEVVCGCDACQTDESGHMGRYELATDEPPVVWSPDEFRQFLLADPEIEPGSDGAGETTDTDGSDGASDRSGGAGGDVSGDADDWLAVARAASDTVRDAFRACQSPGDRSEADYRLAMAVAPWVSADESAVRDVLDTHGTSKWAGRGESYRGSVVADVSGVRDDYTDPLPYWAMCEIAKRDGVVDELVARDADTRDVVSDPQSHDGDTYTALPPRTHNKVLAHVEREYGVDTGREPVDRDVPDVSVDDPDMDEKEKATREELRKGVLARRGVTEPDQTTDDPADVSVDDSEMDEKEKATREELRKAFARRD